MATASVAKGGGAALHWRQLCLPAALLLVLLGFGLAAPSFLTPGNLTSVLVNNVALLAIVALGMTLAVSAGGIDLSVGTSLDVASLAFVALIASGSSFPVALASALAAGAAVGVFNATLVAGIGITPFLATLGTLFIGRSLQQLTTGGGNPIYLLRNQVPPINTAIGQGDVLGIPVPIVVLGTLALAAAFLLAMTRIGREIRAIGAQPAVARWSGLPVRSVTGLVFVLVGLLCATAGVILSCTVNAYVPSSGNAFLLPAIAATFLGTTLDRGGRANVVGTLLGVVVLALVGNGLLLVGWNFYWQQVGTGVLIFLVLAMSFGTGARRGG